MTSRQIYEGVLVELNKEQAPSLLLEDFNYLFNKAINQYVNKQYNIYDANQQTSDDLRVLKSDDFLLVNQENPLIPNVVTGPNALYGATYQFDLPSDYFHLLNCVCDFVVTKPYKCYNAGTHVQFGATRLTADIWSHIINNFYMRPSYKQPYYYITNINTNTAETPNWISNTPSSSITVPTNPIINGRGTDTDGSDILSTGIKDVFGNNYAKDDSDAGLSRTIKIGNNTYNSIEKVGTVRYGNPSNVRIEIRYGKDNSLFQLYGVYIDYLKTPQFIRLTPEQLDMVEDKSQVMEFPDFVCQEIINELVNIVLENSRDPRLQTHPVISQSIANPVQQQQQPQQASTQQGGQQ